MKTKAVYLALAIALACGAVAYGALGGSDADRVAGPRAFGPRVKLSGHVKGLYPGRHRRIRVTVRTPFRHGVKVRLVVARVKDAGPGCSRHNLVTRRSRGLRPVRGGGWRHVRIAPHSARRVRVWLRMRRRAPDACQQARFPLRFRARVRVRA
jgi:hypothetical protein